MACVEDLVLNLKLYNFKTTNKALIIQKAKLSLRKTHYSLYSFTAVLTFKVDDFHSI